VKIVYFNYNGKFLNENEPFFAICNRPFKYGEALNETLIYYNNHLPFIEGHMARLTKGLLKFNFEIPIFLTQSFLEQEISKLILKNSCGSYARVRITFFKNYSDLFEINSNKLNYAIQAWEIEKTLPLLNQNGISLGIYTQAKKNYDDFSEFKTSSHITYSMGAQWAKQNKYNDALIFNSFNNVVDSCIANVFIIKNKKIYTPKITDGCIKGVMRDWIIANENVTEKEITKQDLIEADEIFLTNAVRGIRWVKQIENTEYSSNTITSKIALKLEHFIKKSV
jgi:branched-chain amino acid aminotransferase